MAQALGIRFFDKAGVVLARAAAAQSLKQIYSVDCAARLPALDETEILVACDIRNKLLGPRGASFIYGPQKEASDAGVLMLERNLRHFAKIVRRELDINILTLPGGGAGGGLAAGLVAFAGEQLHVGVELIAGLIGLSQHLRGADLVITGEARIDSQTWFGKTPVGVARVAQHLAVPVVSIGGSLTHDARTVFGHGIDVLESATVREMSLASAIAGSRKNLRDAGERIGRWLVLGKKLGSK